MYRYTNKRRSSDNKVAFWSIKRSQYPSHNLKDNASDDEYAEIESVAWDAEVDLGMEEEGVEYKDHSARIGSAGEKHVGQQ